MARVYCAGPLFNDAERSEMAAIASALERAGHSTFLPQRDSFESPHLVPALRSLGLSNDELFRVVNESIFCLDMYWLLEWSDAIVANLNGRVPDEGTIVEAGAAWRSGKAVVLFKADWRSPFDGYDNPMLLGLGGFRTVSQLSELAGALGDELREDTHAKALRAVRLGKQIAEGCSQTNDPSKLAALLFDLLRPGREAIAP